jgi:hypothetical protein
LVSGFNSSDMLDQMALLGGDDEMTEYFNKFKELIPSESEIINLFKLACSSAHFSEHGLVIKSTSQLPKAK